GGRDVAAAVVAVAGDEDGLLRAHSLGRELIFDEWLPRQVEDEELAAGVEAADLDWPVLALEPRELKPGIAALRLRRLSVVERLTALLLAEARFLSRRQLDRLNAPFPAVDRLCPG